MSEIPQGPENLYIPLATSLGEQITANPNAELVGEIHGRHSLTHPASMELLVAPTTPLYDPESLNLFMDGLVTLGPARRHPSEPHQAKKDYVVLGKLCFDEVVGSKKVQTTTHTRAIDPRILEELGIEEGEKIDEQVTDITRRIWLRVYPTIRLAKDVWSYETSRAADDHFPRNPEMSNLAYSFSPERVRTLENAPAFGHRLKEGFAHFFQMEHHH